MAKMHPLILLPALPPLAPAVTMECTTEHFFSPLTLGETLLRAPPSPPQFSHSRYKSYWFSQCPQTFPAWLSSSASLPPAWDSPYLSVPPPKPATAIPKQPAPSASPPCADTHLTTPKSHLLPGWHMSLLHPSLPFPWDGDHGPLGEVSPWHGCGYVAPVPALRGGNGSSRTVVVKEAQATDKCIVTWASAHTHPGSQEGTGAQRLPLAEPHPCSFCSLPALGCACAKPGWGFGRVIFKTADFGTWLAVRIRGASAI